VPPSRNPNLVLIQKKVTIPGDFNDVVAWVEDRQVWVSINPNRGREVFAGPELTSVVTHTLRGDFLELEGVDETYRAVYNDTHDYDAHGIRADSLVFDLLAVMPDYDGMSDIMIQANLKALRYGDLPPDVPS
jgi:hypothetical protein